MANTKASPIIAGFWRAADWGKPPQDLNRFIQQLVDIGITDFDHAYVYHSEASFGRALALSPDLREQLTIITKCGIRAVGDGRLDAQHTSHYDADKDTIIASVEHSLRALQSDYIDTLLLHRPDYLMDVEQVNEAFNQLLQQGKVKQFGVSNFSCSQFELLQHGLDVKLCSNQFEFSPFYTAPLDNGQFDQCYREGIQPMIWSCLGGGRLFDCNNPISARLHSALAELLEETGATSLAQLIYAWVLMLPSKPRVITGSGNIARIRPLAQASSIKLSREQWYQIWSAAVGHPVA